MKPALCLIAVLCAAIHAQEASRGFELRSTLSAISGYSSILGGPPRDGSDYMAGGRVALYPTWKISSNWAITAAVQAYTRPYFLEQFQTQGRGVKADVLSAHVSYSRFWANGRRSMVIRAGQLTQAFGSFLLRYDDAANPMVNLPMAYGYYYKPVTTLGMPGAQVDLTFDKLDMRLQYAASSMANRRGWGEPDQYGAWTAGLGYTLQQGFRVGASATRGPYLHRQFAFFFPGESAPRKLPALGYGVDAQYGKGAWNLQGEWMLLRLPYHAIPNYMQRAGYAEVKRTLHPRWYVAVRPEHYYSSVAPGLAAVEAVAGFRPNRFQVVKFSYITARNSLTRLFSHTAMIQLVTTPDPVAVAFD